DRTRFYVLDVAEQHPSDVEATSVVGLGPIRLPTYLERSELVTRVGENELRVSQGDRWAEPIAQGFTRVLRERLESRLGVDWVIVFPWRAARTPALAITVDVTRFERQADGNVELRARWTVRAPSDGHIVRAADLDLREPVAQAGTQAAVAALARALERLADE